MANPPITIEVLNDAGDIKVVPDPLIIKPTNDPNVQWNFTPAHGWNLVANTGIVCDTDPPVHVPPYSSWSTPQPTPNGSGNVYQAASPLTAPALFKYAVNIVKNGATRTFDPDIETQPGGMPNGDEGHRKDRAK